MLIPVPIPLTGDRLSQISLPRFQAQPSLELVFESVDEDHFLSHDLGRVPLGYFVIGRSSGLVVYDGETGWTDRVLSLRATATGRARLLIV